MIIDGRAIAAEIEKEIQSQIAAANGRKPCLGVILVGTHPPSHLYVRAKIKACERVGMISIQRFLDHDTPENIVLEEIQKFNQDPTVDGILVQLPLPPHINAQKIIHAISPNKDVDGLHPLNAGKLLTGDSSGFVPCTPLGIKVLLERSGISPSGRHVVILGRSNLVGKPMAALMMQNAPGANATVTIAHSHTQKLQELCLLADILIAAIGQPKFVTADMVKAGAVVVDVGINKLGDRLVGDVDFENVKDKCGAITPVPRGVGPMTIAMLLSNTLKSYIHSMR